MDKNSEKTVGEQGTADEEHSKGRSERAKEPSVPKVKNGNGMQFLIFKLHYLTSQDCLTDKLDVVIEMHDLAVERFPEYVEVSDGNCWYASIAKVVNHLEEKGEMSLSELRIESEEPISHQDIRTAVTEFMQSDDCINTNYWIEQHFDGSRERYL